MTLNLSVDEVLTTTRSVRKRLDFDKPVPREVLMECLDLALQAPTGSNSQGWQWVFVEDADKKKAIGDIYLSQRPRPTSARPKREYPEGDTRGERMGKVRGFGDVPRRAHARGAGADDPLHRRPRRQVAVGRGVVLGVAVPGGLEFLPGAALPRDWARVGRRCTCSATASARRPRCSAFPTTSTARAGCSRSPTPKAPTSSRPSGCPPRA